MKTHILMVSGANGLPMQVGTFDQSRQSHLDKEKSDLKTILQYISTGQYLWMQLIEIDLDLETQKCTHTILTERMKPLPNVVELNVVAKKKPEEKKPQLLGKYKINPKGDMVFEAEW